MKKTRKSKNSSQLDKPVGYLIPKSIFLQGNTLGKFEQISASLLPIFSWKRKSLPKYCFVSHRWLFVKDPDNSLNTFSLIVKAFCVAREDVEYLWIDYVCLPQEASERNFLVGHMKKIVSYASELFIVPLSGSSKSLIPSYDVQSYCFRAWCVFEFSSFMDRPQKISIARLKKNTSDLKVKFLKLPSLEKEDQTMALVNSFVVLKDIVFRNDFEGFQTFYSVSVSSDMKRVWQLLLDNATTLLKIQPDATSFYDEQGNETKDAEEQETFEHHLYKIQNVLGVESGLPPPNKSGMCECETNCNIM
mmetsp:Transcript_1970/g.2554  ORF Transcript_1970/g.2554 Transcript_1970/m.2554 type:complete len:304 (+) Transcript_1970:20-931(+)